MLNNSAGYLQTLINAGSDLMSNLYYVDITVPTVMSEVLNTTQTGLIVRNKDFKAPAATHAEHTVDYMTTSVTLPSTGIDITKTFTLKFRLDANYNVYKFLKAWQSLTSNATYEYASNTVPGELSSAVGDQGFVINVYALPGSISSSTQEIAGPGGTLQSDMSVKLYTFKYCWVKSVKGLSYSYSDSSEMEVSAEIGFFDFEDPQNLL